MHDTEYKNNSLTQIATSAKWNKKAVLSQRGLRDAQSNNTHMV